MFKIALFLFLFLSKVLKSNLFQNQHRNRFSIYFLKKLLVLWFDFSVKRLRNVKKFSAYTFMFYYIIVFIQYYILENSNNDIIIGNSITLCQNMFVILMVLIQRQRIQLIVILSRCYTVLDSKWLNFILLFLAPVESWHFVMLSSSNQVRNNQPRVNNFQFHQEKFEFLI